MDKYEALLFEIAPWMQETARVIKTVNNSSLLRGRSGWVARDIKNPESIYEHTVKVALAGWYLFGTGQAVSQGFCHDMPEWASPDYTPGQKSLTEKYTEELGSMERLSAIIPRGPFWLQNWLEFETKEGIAFQMNELDKICPVINCIDLLKTYKTNNLEEFYPYARGKIQTPELVRVIDEMWHEDIPAGKAYNIYFDKLRKIKL